MKNPQDGIANAIRAEIAKIPSGELPYAKPSRVLPGLEAVGIEITASVRSATSKLLARAKKTAGNTGEGEVITFDPTAHEAADPTACRELAMRLVEACAGNFDLVRTEIARLEQFAKKIKGA
jgi:hypothetical protein